MPSCSFLINAQPSKSPDNPLSYQKGDLFECYPGDIWQPDSPINPHWIGVVVEGMSVEEGKSLCVSTEAMDIATGQQIMTVRRRYFCVENIAPDNVARFYDCVQRGVPYYTDRMSFLSYAVEDKL